MKYLVVASESPRFLSPKKAVQILESLVMPTFRELTKLEEENRIAGGLPVGERSFLFIAEASSNAELDRMLHNLPVWGAMNWKVTPLETFEGRASQCRSFIHEYTSGTLAPARPPTPRRVVRSS